VLDLQSGSSKEVLTGSWQLAPAQATGWDTLGLGS